MSEAPVILIGVRGDGTIGAVGLYRTAEDAGKAVHLNEVPSGFYYSVMTPKMGETMIPRELAKFERAPEASPRS